MTDWFYLKAQETFLVFPLLCVVREGRALLFGAQGLLKERDAGADVALAQRLQRMPVCLVLISCDQPATTQREDGGEVGSKRMGCTLIPTSGTSWSHADSYFRGILVLRDHPAPPGAQRQAGTMRAWGALIQNSGASLSPLPQAQTGYDGKVVWWYANGALTDS